MVARVDGGGELEKETAVIRDPFRWGSYGQPNSCVENSGLLKAHQVVGKCRLGLAARSAAAAR